MKRPPIIILHGWNLSAKYYRKVGDLLENKNYRVFIPDFPGFGSEKTPERPYNIDNYVKFLEKYLNKNKIKKSVIIGHSFGGRVGLKFAISNPEKVEKLVLIGVPGVQPLRIKILLFGFLAKIGKAVFSLPFLNIFFVWARKILYRIIRETDYLKTSGVMRETFKKIISEDLTSDMKKITCPTFLMWGEKDIITPLWIARKMQNLIPNSRLLIINNEGHSFIYKNPELFLKNFISYVG